MSIQKITSKILEDAQGSASQVLQEARQQGEALIEEARKKAEEVKEKSAKEAEEEKERLIARRESVAEIDGRKVVLDAKQRLISHCFEKAIDQITSMEEEKYIAFIVDRIKGCGLAKGEIALNERDKDAIGSKILGELSGVGNFTLAKEPIQIKGGFVLKDGSVYINGSVESLVDEAREELVSQVASKLFQ